MSIYPEKRKGKLTGIFLVEVERDGKRLPRVRCRDIKEARLVEAQLLNGEVIAKANPTTGSRVYTVGDLAKEARAAYSASEDGARSIARMEEALAAIGLSKPLAEVDTNDLDRVVTYFSRKAGRRSALLSPRTVNRYLATISAAFKWARKRGKMKQKPDMPWMKFKENPPLWVADGDDRRMCDWMDANSYSDVAFVLRILIVTGLRINEFLTLESERIYEDTLFIPAEIAKNDTGRYVPIPRPIAGTLRDFVDAGLPSYYSISRAIKQARKALGITRNYTIHTMRHTTATRLTDGGTPTSVVKDLLGHKSINTTLKYAHTTPKALRRAAAVLWSGGDAGEVRGTVRGTEPKIAAPTIEMKALDVTRLSSDKHKRIQHGSRRLRVPPGESDIHMHSLGGNPALAFVGSSTVDGNDSE